MKAAIYARKSTDDNDQSSENKSITRQIEHARAYAEAKGWRIDDELIFTDDGISGAEFRERPGLLKLMAHLDEPDIVVMSEISRLGRDMIQNSVILDKIINEHGVKVHYYLTGKEEKMDTPEARLMVTLTSFAAEMERTKTADRVRDAMRRKAAAGYSTGNRCYGYDNVPIMGQAANGEQVRVRSDWRINEAEAEVLRGIFRMFADGFGLIKIAKVLNGDPSYRKENLQYFAGGTPPGPRGSWEPSSIREMLDRPRYAGILSRLPKVLSHIS